MKKVYAFLLGFFLSIPALQALESPVATLQPTATKASVIERTFAMLKPDAVEKHLLSILQDIKEAGYTIVSMKQQKLSKTKAHELYREHKDKPFFSELIRYITSGPCVVIILEKDNAIKDWRKFIGKSDPRKAARNTLRKKYGADCIHNAVHGADSPRSARREIALIFDPSEYADVDREWFDTVYGDAT